jgi:large subunit ribosomal protein L17
MRHSVFGRKFSRTKNERRRLLQGLVRDLLIHGAIKTTLPKAKAARPIVEKLITKAKNGSRASRNQIEKVLASKDIEVVLLAEAKTRFASRASGFTRIIHLGNRRGDSTEEVLFQLVDEKVKVEVVKPKVKVKKRVKKT